MSKISTLRYFFFFSNTYVTMSDVVFKPQKCWVPKTDVSVRVTHLQYFDTPKRPLGPKFTNLGGICSQDPLSKCQISSRSDNPCMRYPLPKFIGITDGISEKNEIDVSPCSDKKNRRGEFFLDHNVVC